MPFVANPLQLFLCLTNLRGLHYSVQMTAMGGVRGHRVFSHSDYGHFSVIGTNARRPEMLALGSTPVNWPGATGLHDGWERLRDAALATSAFPMGLPARKFDNQGVVYQSKAWPRPAGAVADAPCPTIAPDLSPQAQAPYEFWCVDGGVLNNEPVEFARVALAGAPDARNPREAEKADRAILMIDPFPDEAEALSPFGEEPDLLAVPFALIPAMKMHARFKPEEVMLALDESVYSRFLIAPWREGCKPGETHIAANGLAGFAAFFHESFRRHDFQLGRRNAQKFLRDHLVVHVENKIVKPWVGRFRKEAGKLEPFHPRMPGTNRPDTNYVQLVPLVGDLAAREEKALPWPNLKWKTNIAPLEDAIEERAEKLVKVFMTRLLGLIGLEPGGALNDLFNWIGRETLDDKVAAAAMKKIKEDFSTRGLI